MERQGKHWTEATREDLTKYHKVRTTGQYQNTEKISNRSWNIEQAALRHLFEYAVEKGYIEKVPFKYIATSGFFGKKEKRSTDLRAKFTPEQINFISLSDYKASWRPVISNKRNAQRDLSLVDLLISVGLRISEALGLMIYQIPDPDDSRYVGRKSVGVSVVGKGEKKRTVRIPKRILRAINFYIEEDRATALEKWKKSQKQSKSVEDEPKNVFLSEDGNPWSVRAVEDMFCDISAKTGHKLTPHGCRHTFAVYQLEAMIKRMALNLKSLRESGTDAYRQILLDPLRELQKLLGHSSVTSTYIYLDFLEDAEALVDESLNDWTQWENENGR
jgi:integrase/recombinase XerC